MRGEVNRRNVLIFGCLAALASSGVARGDTLMTEADANDLAWLLANEFETWHRNLAEKGIIPRAFTGVTANGNQAVLILTGLFSDPIQRRNFLIWLCRTEGFVACAYSTQVVMEDDSQALDIYASSDRLDVSKTLRIERRGDGKIGLVEEHSATLSPNDDNGPFFGLQRKKVAISSQDQEAFSSLWREMRPKAMWQSRY